MWTNRDECVTGTKANATSPASLEAGPQRTVAWGANGTDSATLGVTQPTYSMRRGFCYAQGPRTSRQRSWVGH
jgi:hypothetical protein